MYQLMAKNATVVSTTNFKSVQSHGMKTALQGIRYLMTGLALSLPMWMPVGGKAEAASFTFTKVVDTNTPIPGGTGNFTFFFSPALDNGNVAFRAVGSSPQEEGIYTNISGSLNVVADTNTPIPGSTGNFRSLGDPSLNNQNVVFGANFFPQSGIYTDAGGILRVVVDSNTQVPGTSNNFSIFSAPSFNNGSVAFIGEYIENNGSAKPGIYTNIGGSLKLLADTNTPIPGGTGNFTLFPFSPSPVLNSGKVVFQALGNSQSGIYASVDQSLSVVADKNTPIPGDTGNFSFFFSNVAVDNNANVAFVGGRDLPSLLEGVYKSTGGVLNVVADTKIPIPGNTSNLNFCSFDTISLDNGNLAFVGDACPRFSNLIEEAGIYTNLGGSLTKVIGPNDFLDGKILRSISSNLGDEALSGNQIALIANFTDGSRGIYLASYNPTSIPESSALLGILAIGALATPLLRYR